MTDHEGNRENYLARGIQEGLETVDYCPRRSRVSPEFPLGHQFSLMPEGSVIICFIISLYAFCDI